MDDLEQPIEIDAKLRAKLQTLRVAAQNKRLDMTDAFSEFAGAAIVVGGLIGANCLVYGAWQVVDPRVMTRHFTLSNDDVLQYPHTLVTSFFSHASGWHLLGNMVTLFFFGPEAIGALGAARFLAVYVLPVFLLPLGAFFF